MKPLRRQIRQTNVKNLREQIPLMDKLELRTALEDVLTELEQRQRDDQTFNTKADRTARELALANDEATKVARQAAETAAHIARMPDGGRVFLHPTAKPGEVFLVPASGAIFQVTNDFNLVQIRDSQPQEA